MNYTNPRDAYGSGIDDAAGEAELQVSQRDHFIEIGGTGLKRSAGIIDEEFLPALKGPKAVKVYTEMSLNDHAAGSLLFAIEKLLRQVTWNVVADDNTPEMAKAIRFVEECMDDMSHSWDDFIAEVLSMLVYGWSFHEIVYKKRIGPWEDDPSRRSKHSDGRIGWRKMPIRSQETLFRWIFDETGGVRGLTQIPPPQYNQITIPIEKGLLFRTGTHKGNPEGISLLRRAYRPWYYKKRLEEFEAVGVERDLAGMPVARVPSRLMSPKATPEDKRLYQAFKKMVSGIRRDEHEGIVIPSDVDEDTKARLYEFELMSAGGSRTFNTTQMIERYEVAILSVVLADFIKLGHQSAGSYAMHVDKTGIFRASLNSIAEAIADVINRHAIPKLFKINGMKLDALPRLEPTNVDPPNLAELSSFMSTMSGLGMNFFPDPDLEKFLRETAHLPKLSEEVEEQRRQMAEQQNAMNFLNSQMQAQGAEQKAGMVQQGMSPEQAEASAQGPSSIQAVQEGQQIARQNPAVQQQEAEQQSEAMQQAQSDELAVKRQERLERLKAEMGRHPSSGPVRKNHPNPWKRWQ